MAKQHTGTFLTDEQKAAQVRVRYLGHAVVLSYGTYQHQYTLLRRGQEVRKRCQIRTSKLFCRRHRREAAVSK